MIQLYIYIYILFHILFHYGLSLDIEYSSLYYTVGPRCLCIEWGFKCVSWFGACTGRLGAASFPSLFVHPWETSWSWQWSRELAVLWGWRCFLPPALPSHSKGLPLGEDRGLSWCSRISLGLPAFLRQPQGQASLPTEGQSWHFNPGC